MHWLSFLGPRNTSHLLTMPDIRPGGGWACYHSVINTFIRWCYWGPWASGTHTAVLTWVYELSLKSNPDWDTLLLQVFESSSVPPGALPQTPGKGHPSLPVQLPSAAISEFSEPLEGPLGTLRVVVVWVGAGKKALPVGICQDFILLMSQWGEHRHSPGLAPTCPPLL